MTKWFIVPIQNSLKSISHFPMGLGKGALPQCDVIASFVFIDGGNRGSDEYYLENINVVCVT